MSSDEARFKSKPLIRNAIHPNELFTQEELDLIKASVLRRISLERYNRKATVKEEERQQVLELLKLAEFHGYYPNGIKPNGKLRWMVMCESYLPELAKHSVITTIRKCEECGRSFHAHHYQDEQPGDLCRACDRKATIRARKEQEQEKQKPEQEEVPF